MWRLPTRRKDNTEPLPSGFGMELTDSTCFPTEVDSTLSVSTYFTPEVDSALSVPTCFPTEVDSTLSVSICFATGADSTRSVPNMVKCVRRICSMLEREHRYGIPDSFAMVTGARDYQLKYFGLSPEQAAENMWKRWKGAV